MKRYIKVYFKLVAWDNDNSSGSCYVYTSNPGFRCSANNGKASAAFSVTVRSSSDSAKVTESVTMWLSDEDRRSLTKDEAYLYQDIYGAVCYIAVDTDNHMKLTPMDDFLKLPAEHQANVVTSLQPASAPPA